MSIHPSSVICFPCIGVHPSQKFHMDRHTWFVCGWQVKLCDPVVTHGPCLTSRCCPAWQLIRLIIAVLRDRCCVVERFDLTVIKAAYCYYYCIVTWRCQED